MNNYLCILLVALAMSTNACSRQDRQVESLPDFEQLVQKEYIDPYKTGDTEGWLEVFADDAVGMHNTLPALVGKEALRGFAETVHGAFDIEQLDVTVDSVTTEGDWALTRGNFVASFLLKGEDVDNQAAPRQGKYILLWERQDDGAWKVILDMGNNNSP